MIFPLIVNCFTSQSLPDEGSGAGASLWTTSMDGSVKQSGRLSSDNQALALREVGQFFPSPPRAHGHVRANRVCHRVATDTPLAAADSLHWTFDVRAPHKIL